MSKVRIEKVVLSDSSDDEMELKPQQVTSTKLVKEQKVYESSSSESEYEVPIAVVEKPKKPRKPMSEETRAKRVESLAKAREAKKMKAEATKAASMKILKGQEKEIMAKAQKKLDKDKKKAVKQVYKKLVEEVVESSSDEEEPVPIVVKKRVVRKKPVVVEEVEYVDDPVVPVYRQSLRFH